MKQAALGFVMTIGVCTIIAVTAIIGYYEPMRVAGLLLIAFALKKLVLR